MSLSRQQSITPEVTDALNLHAQHQSQYYTLWRRTSLSGTVLITDRKSSLAMLTSIKKPVLATALSALLIFELSGCGTLIYPERRGQSNGRIDPSVAILNGIGLLFWDVPGLVAFAIDIATGAIYLPSGRYSVAPEQLQRAIQEDGQIDTVQLQQIIQQQTGQQLPLNHPNLQQQPSSPELLSQLNIVPAA